MDTRTNELIAEWRAMGPVAWCESAYGWIGDTGQPVTLEPWQRAALSAWWQYRFEVSTLALSCIKKSGKTFTNAVLLAWRWLCLPGQHYAQGNDLDQSQARQFSEVAEMCKRHPYLSQVVTVNKNELTFTPTGSKLTALAVDAAGNAGANHISISHTEAWAVIYEQGIRAWEELTPPPGSRWGFPCLRIADSYSGFINESKVWHGVIDRALAGERIDDTWPIFRAGQLLVFHATGEWARSHCFRGSPAEAEAYYTEQRASLRPEAFSRMHDNVRTSSESAFIAADVWEACHSREVKPLSPNEKVRLILAADASTTRDYSALIGVVYDSAENVTDVRFCKVYKPKLSLFRAKPTIDLSETIEADILALHARGQVQAVCYDPFQLHSIALELAKKGVKMIEMPQTTLRTEADTLLYDCIQGGAVKHYGDKELTEAVLNAAVSEGPRGIRLVKQASSRKIDACVCLSMANWASRQRENLPWSGPGWLPIDVEGYSDPDDVVTWELQSGQPWQGQWHVNHLPHPPGTDYTTCKYRARGCLACYQETRAEEEQEREFLKNSVTLSEADFRQWQYELRHPYSPPPTAEEESAERTVKLFWKTIHERINKNV